MTFQTRYVLVPLFFLLSLGDLITTVWSYFLFGGWTFELNPLYFKYHWFGLSIHVFLVFVGSWVFWRSLRPENKNHFFRYSMVTILLLGILLRIMVLYGNIQVLIDPYDANAIVEAQAVLTEEVKTQAYTQIILSSISALIMPVLSWIVWRADYSVLLLKQDYLSLKEDFDDWERVDEELEEL